MDESAAAGRITDGVTRLETENRHFEKQLEMLPKIHDSSLRNEMNGQRILERLDKGERQFEIFNARISAQGDRLQTAELRLKDLNGTKERPSFEDLQDAHLRRRSAFLLLSSAWGTLIAAGMAAGAWLGLPFWHHTPRP